MKIISVVGARPNFMKIAPFINAVKSWNESGKSIINHILVHTGQHYDVKMSEAFFSELNIPEPDINLEVGSGTHAEQLGYTMIGFEKVLIDHKPDWVVVVGDVNATLACSVIAKRLNIKVCHIEAGLRSGDKKMPEEINRLVTDRISDLLLTPDRISSENLKKEGTPEENIVFTGNIMIDTLESARQKAANIEITDIIRNNLPDEMKFSGEIPGDQSFAVLTLHRPSNVDQKETLTGIIDFVTDVVTKELTIIWPIHPRTRKQLKNFGLWQRVISHKSVILLEPLGYHEMLRLNMGARIILTDSGGIQEESCILGTPCLTMRWNTERPVTLSENGGVSVLVGNDLKLLKAEFIKNLNKEHLPSRPELWDGHTAERCLAAIMNPEYGNNSL